MIHGDRIFAIKWTDNRASSYIKYAHNYMFYCYVFCQNLSTVRKGVHNQALSHSILQSQMLLKEDVDAFFES